jgi:hypothetical protein
MPSEHLNFFEPWPDLAAHHENQLTRAFLVILRLCPAAHQAWLRLVDPELDLGRLPAPTFDTQTAQLTRAHLPTDDDDLEPAIRGISVLQAADVQAVSGPVTESERRAIFDGIVSYGDELVLVVEVKLTAPPSDTQAREVPLRGRRVQMDETARPVDWRALLEAWQGMALEGWVSGAEKKVLSDFLEFVERRHPSLGPNSRLRLCGVEDGRLLSRLKAIFEDVVGDEAWIETQHRWTSAWIPGDVALGIHLGVRGVPASKVILALYPANTLKGARVLFGQRPEHARAVAGLEATGWDVSSAFHMGFIQTDVAFDEWGFCDAESYAGYWIEHIGAARRRPRAEWVETAREMAQSGVVSPNLSLQIEALPAHMDRLSPKPTIELVYSWPLDDAKRLDDNDMFTAAVHAKLAEALTAIGDPIPGTH